ncbi:MAG: hypothetical protein AB2L14_04670 [Candidatus Xenobiia bacterium LiM19]
MKLSTRVFTAYEQEELKKKAAQCLCILGLLILLFLAASVVLRPAPALPPPGGSFKTLNLELQGRIEIPSGIQAAQNGKGRYLKGLRLTFEMPDIPLTLDKKDSELLIDREGRYTVTLKDLSVLTVPKTLNVRARLEGHGECVLDGVGLSPDSTRVMLPEIVFQQ